MKLHVAGGWKGVFLSGRVLTEKDREEHFWSVNIINNSYFLSLSCLLVIFITCSSEKEGNVYVQDAQTGEWGLICDDGWSYRAGKIVCQMLGYHITRITTNDAYGASPTGVLYNNSITVTFNLFEILIVSLIVIYLPARP